MGWMVVLLDERGSWASRVNAQHIMWMLLEAARFPSMWSQRAAVLVCIF